jgi:hypothetical protein
MFKAGKDCKLLHPHQALSKVVPELTFTSSRSTRFEQKDQVDLKFVPEERSNNGKDVIFMQFDQAKAKLETQDVSTSVLQKYGGSSQDGHSLVEPRKTLETWSVPL